MDATSDCHVLEFGFGLGYSAEGPRTHMIIEFSAPVLQRPRL